MPAAESVGEPIGKPGGQSPESTGPPASAVIERLRTPVGKRPKAIAFVDFEYWSISMDKIHHLPVNPLRWYERLREEYDVVEIRFYGDFSNEGLHRNVGLLREISHLLIDTRNISSFYKKDFTDFILLDGIYQTLLFHDEYETYILFSGDGHFCPAMVCLRNQCGKNVVVYGVRGSFSAELKRVCNSYVELPNEEEISSYYESMVLSSLDHLFKKNPNAHPSFWRTVDNVSAYNGVEPEVVRAAMLRLKEKGYLVDKVAHLGLQRTAMALSVEWDKLAEDGLWDPEKLGLY